MSPRASRRRVPSARGLAHEAVILAWAGFFAWLYFGGEWTRFVGPRTAWVVPFGLVGLLACALLRLLGSGDARPLGAGGLLGCLLLVSPILAVAAVPDATLGTLAASRKARASALHPAAPLSTATPAEAFLALSAAEGDRAGADGLGPGTALTVEGFVLGRGATTRPLPAGHLELGRFAIVCCAADAVPHTVEVDASAAPGLLGHPPDRWLSVSGTLEREDGRLVLAAEGGRAVPEPANPYAVPSGGRG